MIPNFDWDLRKAREDERKHGVTFEDSMKKKIAPSDDPLDREIDFSNARPNPYARDYYKSRNLRVLAPDLLDVFPDSESVNEALRTLVRITAAMPQRVSAKTATAPKKVKKAHS